MKKLTLVTIVFVLLSACAPSVDTVQTAIAETQAGWTPIPTQTAYPTYTPEPTVYVTKVQTKIVEKIVTPTAPAEFMLVQEFSGTGKGTTDLFTLQSGTIRIEWEYTGSSNFAFYIRRLDNDAEQLIENTIGSADGQMIIKVGLSDQYLFDVKFASGNWTIKVFYKP